MSQFYHSNKPVHVIAKGDLRAKINQGHPWLMSYEVEPVASCARGALGLLKTNKGVLLAKGIVDPESPLLFRVLDNSSEPFTDAIVTHRLSRAIALRKASVPPHTNCYRLINGEGDELPGLVCDIYNSIAVLKLDGAAPSHFWRSTNIAAWLAGQLGLTGVYERTRTKVDQPTTSDKGTLIWGTLDGPEVIVEENGHIFAVNIFHGQKTGFFLDQRENRHFIGSIAHDAQVLNLFGYTGGFSIYAGKNGAKHVTTVDSAKPAIAMATQNWELNNLRASAHTGTVADVYDFLESAHTSKQFWDLIIVDPPAFVQNAAQLERGLAAYKSLFTLALRALTPNGVIAFASCSGRVRPLMFEKVIQESLSRARKRAQVISVRNLPSDHPYPFACPELDYLKFTVLRVS